MRVGETVHLKFYPASWGTVSKADGDRFQVTWHVPGRRTHQARLRVWYGPDAIGNIRAGHPVD